MPANARAILIEALRDAHRWLDELLSDPRLTLESIASREDKSERSIRMTLSLAFLAPEIVKRQSKDGCRAGLVSSVSSTCRWPGRISGARSDSRRRRRRKETIRPCSFVSRRGVIHPFEPDQVSRFDPSTFEIGRGGHVASATLETEICGRRLSARRVRNCP